MRLIGILLRGERSPALNGYVLTSSNMKGDDHEGFKVWDAKKYARARDTSV